MYLFLFLGNIGKKYETTRHNAGFLFGDFLREKWNFPEWKENKKFFGSISEGELSGEKILFLKPHTLMNRSGKSVRAAINFYRISTDHIVLFHDDSDMEFGKVRYREKGSSGGHRGVDDCIRVLNTNNLKRIKFGIDNSEREFYRETADFVLAKFTKAEWAELRHLFEEGEDKLITIIEENQKRAEEELAIPIEK